MHEIADVLRKDQPVAMGGPMKQAQVIADAKTADEFDEIVWKRRESGGFRKEQDRRLWCQSGCPHTAKGLGQEVAEMRTCHSTKDGCPADPGLRFDCRFLRLADRARIKTPVAIKRAGKRMGHPVGRQKAAVHERQPSQESRITAGWRGSSQGICARHQKGLFQDFMGRRMGQRGGGQQDLLSGPGASEG